MAKFLSCLLFVAVFVSLCVPTLSRADDITAGTGNQLIKVCNEKFEAENGDAWVMCAMYIEGIVEGLQMGIRLDIVNNNPNITTQELNDKVAIVWKSCPPNNISGVEAARVVTNFITEHPNDLNNSTTALVMGAFINAWPCRKIK